MSQLTRDAREPEKRKRVLAVVTQQPGANFRRIAQLSGVAAGTTRHHLNVLLRQDRIWDVRRESYLLHFPGPRPVNEAAVAAAVRGTLDDLDAALLGHVQDAGRIAQKDLLNLGVAGRSTTQHRLARLVRRGYLATTWQGRWLFYSLPTQLPMPTTPWIGVNA